MNKKPDPKDYPPLTPHDLEWGGIGSKYYEDYAKWEKGNKSNDSFQWTDELVEEYLEEEYGMGYSVGKTMSNFKKKRTPKPQAEGKDTFSLNSSHKQAENKPDWEIVKCLGASGTLHHYNPDKCLGADKNVMPCTIYSVKRISDGEVFFVGDEVSFLPISDYGSFKIHHFMLPKSRPNVLMACNESETISEDVDSHLVKKLPPQPQKEEQRIEVKERGWNMSAEVPYSHCFVTPQPIPEDKRGLIIKAIESVLNKDAPAFDWMFRYTQSQVDSMCEDAFNAAREVFEEQVTGRIEYINGDWSLHHPPKYMNFKDYKQSKQ